MSSITFSFKKDVYSYLQEQRLILSTSEGSNHFYENSTSSNPPISPIDYLANITSPFRSDNFKPKDSGFLPPGVKIITDDYIVYERPPAFKTIFYSSTMAESVTDDTIKLYTIPIPWQLYVAKFSDDYLCFDVNMYFMDTPLQSLDQPLYMPTIPNFYTSGLLCRPRFATMDEVTRYTQDAAGIIASSYDWIWNNGTNSDLTETLVHLLLQNLSGQIATLASQKMPHNFKENRLSSMTYISPSEVDCILSCWETLSLEDIMSYKWPNPSRNGNFSYGSASAAYRDLPAYNDNLYDYVYEILSEEYGEEPYESSIEDVIESEDYNHNIYVNWLISNGHVQRISPEWENPFTYIDLLQDLKNTQSFKKTSFMMDFHNCINTFFPIAP